MKAHDKIAQTYKNLKYVTARPEIVTGRVRLSVTCEGFVFRTEKGVRPKIKILVTFQDAENNAEEDALDTAYDTIVLRQAVQCTNTKKTQKG